MLGGPVAAVGGFFIGKAIEKGIENSPEAQRNIGAVVNEVGLRGVSSLSSASLERNRDEAETAAAEGRPGAFSEGGNLLTAAATLLSIGTVKKLLNKAGDLIPSGMPSARDVIATAFDRPSPLAGAKGVIEESAEAVNATFPRHPVFDPPFTPGTITRTFTTTQETTLVRVTADASRLTGGFFVQAREIVGKTPEEIRVYLGLPDTPAYIQTVKIPAGTVLREGQVGPQLKFQPNDKRTVSPGAIQFQAFPDSPIPEGNFGTLTPIKPTVPVR